MSRKVAVWWGNWAYNQQRGVRVEAQERYWRESLRVGVVPLGPALRFITRPDVSEDRPLSVDPDDFDLSDAPLTDMERQAAELYGLELAERIEAAGRVYDQRRTGLGLA